ncbi:MAG: hypothetical protein JNL11_04575 [Bdellovibrionaceae bacterium]|nr:hypothetical protein [Pseudobdellovibrionaceae bacterium]
MRKIIYLEMMAILMAGLIMIGTLGCSSKKPKTEMANLPMSLPLQSTSISAEVECFHPQFSYRGDQILYICQEKKFNSQPQLFIEDLNTGLKKQMTFQDGELKAAHFLRPDLLVYLSSTDTRKENVPLLSSISKPLDVLQMYSFDLRNDEIERITENNLDEIFVVPLKNIDPKVAFVRIESGTYKVYQKNLANKSEKIIFKSNHPISEIGVSDANQILVVEDTGYKKMVRLIENAQKQTLWPEFKRDSQSFYLDSKTGELEYLDSMKIKSISLKNLCESELFSFSEPILEFQKSPVVDNLYVYTTLVQGLRRIERKVIPKSPAQPCKKIVRRR